MQLTHKKGNSSSVLFAKNRLHAKVGISDCGSTPNQERKERAVPAWESPGGKGMGIKNGNRNMDFSIVCGNRFSALVAGGKRQA